MIQKLSSEIGIQMPLVQGSKGCNSVIMKTNYLRTQQEIKLINLQKK